MRRTDLIKETKEMNKSKENTAFLAPSRSKDELLDSLATIIVERILEDVKYGKLPLQL